MAHECEDCGQTFETLTRRRLHDCPDATGAADEDDVFGGEWLEQRGQKRRREREQLATRTVSETFTRTLQQAEDGDAGAALTALAQYERELAVALDRDDGGDAYRAVFWTYYEPVVAAIDGIAREEGWPFLQDIVSAYDYREEGALSDVTAVTTNLVARGVIRTRLHDDVEAIPTQALAYLGSVPEFDTESYEITWEESQHVGWGIGHPEYPLEEAIRNALPDQDIWAGAAALRAVYADQHAGVSLYCEVLEDAEDPGFALDRLAHFEGEPQWELFPRGWDVNAEFDRDLTFTFEETVAEQIRTTVDAIGYAKHLRDGWDFEDLELRW